MEGLAASNNSIFISTPTGSVYVATAGTMTVAGNAFSVGASTLSVVGGMVGVGVSAPAVQLDVRGTSGTIAVGNTSPHTDWYWTAYHGIEMNGGGAVFSGNGSAFLSANYYVRNVGGLATDSYMISAPASNIYMPDQDFYFRVAPSGTAGNPVTWTNPVNFYGASAVADTLVVKAGRVGIGTGSPATTLDVRGNAVFNSSVTASAFYGDGSNLTGISGSGVTAASSPTWSGSHTFLNTVTVSTTLVSNSSVTASAFFGNGSALTGLAGESNTYASSKTFTTNVLMQASATASGFFGNGSALTGLPVAQTTVTYNLTGATTETTTFKVCYASGTLTTNGSSLIQVHYSGSITNSGAAGTYCILNIMQDGAFISPYTSTVGMGASVNGAAGGFGNATMTRIFPAPSAGSHSWCLSMISPFGTTCTFTYASAHGNEFGVTELR